jgi:hypothetical protein
VQPYLFDLSLWIEQLRQTDASGMCYRRLNSNLLYISVFDEASREIRLTTQAMLSERRIWLELPGIRNYPDAATSTVIKHLSAEIRELLLPWKILASVNRQLLTICSRKVRHLQRLPSGLVESIGNDDEEYN